MGHRHHRPAHHLDMAVTFALGFLAGALAWPVVLGIGAAVGAWLHERGLRKHAV